MYIIPGSLSEACQRLVTMIFQLLFSACSCFKIHRHSHCPTFRRQPTLRRTSGDSPIIIKSHISSAMSTEPCRQNLRFSPFSCPCVRTQENARKASSMPTAEHHFVLLPSHDACLETHFIPDHNHGAPSCISYTHSSQNQSACWQHCA